MAMTMQGFQTFSLNGRDVENLPLHIPRPVDEAESATGSASQKYLLTIAPSERDARILETVIQLFSDGLKKDRTGALDERVSEAFDERLTDRRTNLSEELINLVEEIVQREEAAKFDRDIKMDNVRLVEKYFETVETLSAEDVHALSGETTKNRNEPASKWTRERKIFAIEHRNAKHYPTFQFQDIGPHPIIARVLKSLPEDFSPWETAFWFASSNGWLNSKTPTDCLDDPDALVAAAEHLRNPTVG